MTSGYNEADTRAKQINLQSDGTPADLLRETKTRMFAA